MKIPRGADAIARFAKDTIDECLVSRETRRAMYGSWRNVFLTGSDNTGSPAKVNKCFNHIDKLSSYLFSPTEVRFAVDFDGWDRPEWKPKAERASRALNRNFARRKVNTRISQANLWALVKGATHVRINWGANGFQPYAVQPEFFGVRNEGIDDLDDQDAFVQTSYLTETQLRRSLNGHLDEKQIMRMVGAAFDRAASAVADDSWMGGSVSLGGSYPGGGIAIPGITTPSPGARGAVDLLSMQPGPMLSPEVQSRLVELHELWVWNDEEEDYTTLLYVDPGILLEGRYQLRNLTGVKGRHPFTKICSNEMPGYYWGRSDIANVWTIQKMLNRRIDNIDSIYAKQANPPRAFRGFSGLSMDKARGLMSPDALLIDGAPSNTTHIDTLAPTMPQGYMEYIAWIEQKFDEAGGFTPILSGQGEPGVRAGNHANTLLRTSTPRLRDRALEVEQQVADVGEFCFYLMRAKETGAEVHTTSDKSEFMLSQIPDDASVIVDSHSSSPAFSAEYQQIAFALRKEGDIGPASLIRMLNLPREDELISEAEEQGREHAAAMQWLKQNDPDMYAKAISGAKKR